MAEKFTQHTGRVVPLDAANVDTDAIIPKQFLQKVTRTGFHRKEALIVPSANQRFGSTSSCPPRLPSTTKVSR